MKKLFNYLIIILVCFSCSEDDTMTPVEVPDVVAEFRTNLSELNLFIGNLEELNITAKAFEYNLSTTLFSDYAHKQRIIALPNGAKMEYNGDGLPIFPESSVIAKTFYYNNDERDLSLGRQIIETRVLIKIDGAWQSGNYRWNNTQTEATLDLEGRTLPISWIDAEGNSNSTNYNVPSDAQCFTCHASYQRLTPIGPKLRNLNFEINGINQLQQFINDQKLDGLTSITNVTSVPNWKNISEPLEDRARAYMAINCAHCHIPGGFCDEQSTLNLAYDTSFENSNIFERQNSINSRISTYLPGVSMPYIGTTLLHNEGVELLQDYLNTL